MNELVVVRRKRSRKAKWVEERWPRQSEQSSRRWMSSFWVQTTTNWRSGFWTANPLGFIGQTAPPNGPQTSTYKKHKQKDLFLDFYAQVNLFWLQFLRVQRFRGRQKEFASCGFHPCLLFQMPNWWGHCWNLLTACLMSLFLTPPIEPSAESQTVVSSLQAEIGPSNNIWTSRWII